MNISYNKVLETWEFRATSKILDMPLYEAF